MLNEKLLSYASYFVSFLIDNLGGRVDNVNRIILFGSVARKEAVKRSDVDFFVDVKRNSAGFRRMVGKIEKDFYESREGLLFKVRGVDNKVNVKVGKLDEWKDLRESLAEDSVVLFGRGAVEGQQKAGEREKMVEYLIMSWEKVGKNRGAFLNKLYGFNVRGKRYEGLLEKFGGRRIGKSCIMVPRSKSREIGRLFKKYIVKVRVMNVLI